MLDTLSKIGGRLTGLFGDPDIGYAQLSLNDYNEKSALCSGAPFAKIIPYEAFDEETGVFIGINSLGFAIEALPIVGGDDATEKMISLLFTEMLEEDASLQCLLLADHRTDEFLKKWEDARKAQNPTLHQLAKKRTEHFKAMSKTLPRMFRFILSYSVPSENYNRNQLQLLKEKKDKFLETLRPLTYATAWTPNDLIASVGGIINFSSSRKSFQRRWNPHQSLASQLTSGGKISVLEDRLEWTTDRDSAFKSYRALDFPSNWSLANMGHLIGDFFRDAFRVQTPFYIHFGVHCPKQNTVEPGFWRKAHLIDNQGKSSTLLRWIPELEKELKENDYIRRSLNQGARFVWTQLSTGLWAEKEEIHRHEEVLKGLFKINHFNLVENRCVHLPQLIASLPMTWAEHVKDLKNLSLLRTTLSTECVNFVPLQGEWLGTPTPCMLLLGRRGQLLNWNPFDNKTGNYNVVVAGRSGSGKSVFMQELLMNGLSIGAKVYVLEVGRSFEKLNDLLEGQQIEFSKASNICLNPFSNICTTDKDAQDISISFLKSIIGCMAAPNSGTSDFENAVIESAIRAVWDHKGNEATITDVAACLLANEDARAKTLGTMLTPYTKRGVYAKHFEGKNNVNFNNPMVLIELEELKDKKDLQAVVLQLFIMTITNQAFLGDRQTPFFICIDEAWDLLRNSQSGPFIETLARRLRKYHGSLVIGTQGIEDFFATPGAKAAYENSDWICLLSQKNSSIHAMAESRKIDFTEGKKIALESIATRQGEYSEIMICDAEGGYSTARLLLDKFSELLYTTKADEFAAIKALRNQGHTVTSAIEQVLARRKHA